MAIFRGGNGTFWNGKVDQNHANQTCMQTISENPVLTLSINSKANPRYFLSSPLITSRVTESKFLSVAKSACNFCGNGNNYLRNSSIDFPSDVLLK